MSEDQADQTPPAATPRALRAALLMYPRASRAEHARELEAVFADATTGAGRVAVAREALDVAGAGLRLRLGLASRGRTAAIVARAAPLAAAAYTGPGIGSLVGNLRLPGYFRQGPLAFQLMIWDETCAPVLWLAVLALVLAGRWPAARTAATVGTLAQIPLVLAVLPEAPSRAHAVSAALLPSVAVWLLLIAAPRDLLGSPRGDGRLVAGLLALGVLPVVAQRLLYRGLFELGYPLGFQGLVWVLVLLGAGLFIRLTGTLAPALVLSAAVALLPYAVPLAFAAAPVPTLAFVLIAALVLVLAWRRDRQPAARP